MYGMTPAHRLRLAMLRDAACDVLQDYRPEEQTTPKGCVLGVLLLALIDTIDDQTRIDRSPNPGG